MQELLTDSKLVLSKSKLGLQNVGAKRGQVSLGSATLIYT